MYRHCIVLYIVHLNNCAAQYFAIFKTCMLIREGFVSLDSCYVINKTKIIFSCSTSFICYDIFLLDVKNILLDRMTLTIQYYIAGK